MLAGDMPTFCPPPSWLEALGIYTSLCQHQLALCPDSLHPFSPAAWPGFYLSSPELITVSFVDLEITKIMKIPGAA